MVRAGIIAVALLIAGCATREVVYVDEHQYYHHYDHPYSMQFHRGNTIHRRIYDR